MKVLGSVIVLIAILFFWKRSPEVWGSSYAMNHVKRNVGIVIGIAGLLFCAGIVAKTHGQGVALGYMVLMACIIVANSLR